MWPRLAESLTLRHAAGAPGLSPCRRHPRLSLTGWLLTRSEARGGRRRLIPSWAPTPIPRSRSRGSSDTRARACSRAHTQTHTGTHARGPARARTRRCVHTGVLRLASTLQGKALLHPDVQAAGGPANRPRDVTMPWRRCRLLCLLDARAVCSSTSFSLHRPAYRNPDLGKAPPAWTGRAQGHTAISATPEAGE